jgi:hypothetical protein
MKNFLRLTLLLLLLSLLLPEAQAQDGPNSFVPGLLPPTPPLFDQAIQAPAAVQLAAAQVCAPTLEDSDVEASPTLWKRLPSGAAATVDTAEFYSGQQSLKLQAGSGSTRAVGQTALPVSSAATAIYGSLWFRYASGTAESGDKLNVALYKDGTSTSPLLTLDAFDLAKTDGTWYKFAWSLTDPVKMATLRSLGSVTFQVTMINSIDGSTRSLWLDDLTMDVCLAGIDGTLRSTQGGAGLAGAQILLAKNTDDGSTIFDNTISDALGRYSFTGLSALDGDETYQVWFLNASTAASRPDTQLGFWAGPTVNANQLLAQPTLIVADMILGDVILNSPASYSQSVMTDADPVTLSWTKRAVTGETYQLCVYDPQRIDPATSLPAQVCGAKGDTASFVLSPQSFNSVPAFGFEYGRHYRWYVVAYAADGQYGYAFYERAITLLDAASTAPTETVTPSENPPAAASATADWLLMVYAAGDNELGDPQRVSRLALLDNQLEWLRDLAASYPSLHLVTLSDAYGDTGTQLCYLPPTGTPDCQQQGEINTGDPATLGSFVQTALARYPANHSMLIIAGPGDPIGGIGRDLTTPGAPAIDIADLRTAYDEADLGSSKLDIVFYQAPLMGNLAVVTATAPYARYMVAAADQYWHLPLYNSILPLLSGAKKDLPAEVAQDLPEIYNTAVSDIDTDLARSLAVYDLSQAAGVNTALNLLSSELQAALVSNTTNLRTILRRLRRNVIVYDASGNGLHNALEQVTGDPLAIQEDGLVDIRRLATTLQGEESLPQTLRDASRGLASAISGSQNPLVLSSVQVSGTGVAGWPVSLENTAGVSAFFPTGVRLGGQPTLSQHYLYGASGEPRDSAWADFLRDYLKIEVGSGPGGVTAGPSGDAQFRGPVGGIIELEILFMPWVSR